MTFNYLGAKITSNRDLKEEIRAIVSGFLRNLIWRNKHMSISKIRMYKTY